MFDAAGVRNAAGQQAKLLNQIVDEFLTDQHFNAPKMKELLGHTRLEVFAGLVTGVIVAIAVVSPIPTWATTWTYLRASRVRPRRGRTWIWR